MELILKENKLYFAFQKDTPVTQKLLSLWYGRSTRLGDIAFCSDSSWYVTDAAGKIIQNGFKTYAEAQKWENHWAKNKLKESLFSSRNFRKKSTTAS